MRILLAAFAALCLVVAADGVAAQGAAVPFGDIRHDNSLPVEVTADQLDIDQQSGVAVFTGNVLVGQGEMRLKAPRLRVEYARRAADGSGGRIERMQASDGVILNNGRATAEAEAADYTVATGVVVMTGNVILTQDSNVLAGERFVVQLRDGTGVMTGRVRTILQQSDGQ